MKTWKKNGLEISMSSLVVTPTDLWVGRRRQWEMTDEFVLNIQSDGVKMEVIVPKGFCTDFATIPLIAQLFVGNHDSYAPAAVVHDFLCYTHVPQWICNSWLRAAMFCIDAPVAKQIAYFYAVQLFGYQSFLQRFIRWVKWKIYRGKDLVVSRFSNTPVSTRIEKLPGNVNAPVEKKK